MIPPNATCEETLGMVGDAYIRCNGPAIMKIKHRGRAEGPYYMCLIHGCHNADNRDAEVLETKDPDVAQRYKLEVQSG